MIVLLRAVLLYILIVFSLRIMGKRQIGQLQPSELVVTILVSNIASIPIENPDTPMLTGIIPIITLVSFDLIVSMISLRSKKFRTLISGKPIVIIKDGKIDQKALKTLRYSIDDLTESLRGSGIFDIDEVAFAVIETTGTISFLQKFNYQTVTAEMLDLKGRQPNPPVVIISDGELLKEALPLYNLTEKWVLSVLKSKNLRIDEIFIMTADSDKKVNIIKKEGIN